MSSRPAWLTDEVAAEAVKNPVVQDAALDAAKNPEVQKAVGNAAWSAAKDPNNQKAAGDATVKAITDYDKAGHAAAASSITVSKEELDIISGWASRLRIAMLLLSTLMVVVAFFNIITISLSIAHYFLAGYVLFFAVLICCYEIAFSYCSKRIATNFGFMYHPWGRTVFLLFVAILLFNLSLFGIILGAVLVAISLVYIYVHLKHPAFETYMRKLHYHKQASGGGAPSTGAWNV
jgi:hypothetical protein